MVNQTNPSAPLYILVVEDSVDQVEILNLGLAFIADKVMKAWKRPLDFTFTNTGADAISALSGKTFRKIDAQNYFVRKAADIESEPIEFDIAILDNQLVGDILGINIPQAVRNNQIIYGLRSANTFDANEVKSRGFSFILPKTINLTTILDMVAQKLNK